MGSDRRSDIIMALALDGRDLFVWDSGYFRHVIRYVWGAAGLLHEAPTRAGT